MRAHLVQEELRVRLGERLRRLDDRGEIRLHQLEHDVELAEGVKVGRDDNIAHAHQVLVLKHAQEA